RAAVVDSAPPWQGRSTAGSGGNAMKRPTSETRRDLLLALGGGLALAPLAAPAAIRSLVSGATLDGSVITATRTGSGALVNVTVSGNRAVAAIQISVLGLGLVAIEAIFDFENAQSLTPTS